MERQLKIFLMAFIGLVFPCLSFAYPDMYFFDNFLQGASPFLVDTSNFSLNAETGLWETYKPSLGDTTQSDIKNGIVVSFSDDFMSGTSPQTAVPYIDLSKVGSGRVVLEPGGSMVVSSAGDITRAFSTEKIKGIPLGFTSPSSYSIDNMGNHNAKDYFYSMTSLLTSDGSSFQDFPYYMNVNFVNKMKESSIYCYAGTSFPLLQDDSSSMNYSPYADCSTVWLLINDSTSTAYISSQEGNGPLININYVAYNGIKWVYVSSGNISPRTTAVITDRRGFFFPHIAGDLDLYSPLFDELISGSDYAFSYSYQFSTGLVFNAWTDNSVNSYLVTFYNPSKINNSSDFFCSTIADIEAIDGSKIPIFLHSAVRYIDSTAIMVNGGYININNYEELVALLKKEGVGQADLSRITQLLEEINSGGATGAEVKELIGILENYHQQLVNNADFGSVTNVFESYKNLLDFSDDMHWLITANNALFGYFTGFILMCAMFLILNRIMR